MEGEHNKSTNAPLWKTTLLSHTRSLPPPFSKQNKFTQDEHEKEQEETLNLLQNNSYDFSRDNVTVKTSTATTPSLNTTMRKDSDFGSDSDSDSDSGDFHFLKHRDTGGNFDVVPDLENQNDYGKIKKIELVRRHISSANSSFQRANSNINKKPVLMRMKTKSRLMDPPLVERALGWMDNRSKMLGKSGEFNDEDDPFGDEDLPEEFQKGKISFLTVVQWASLIMIVTALICSLVIAKWKAKAVWGMQLWKWEVVGLVLICGGLVSGWLMRIVLFFIKRNIMLRKRVLYFVYSLRKSIQNFLWLGWGLLAWILILDKRIENEKNSRVLPYVTKILICLMVATLLWFFKTLLLKVLAMNFHVSAFFDRIQDALFNQYVIEMLSGLGLVERVEDKEEDGVMKEVREFQDAGFHVPADLLKTSCLGSPRVIKTPSFKRDDGGGIHIDYLHRLNQENISTWNMKRLMSVVRKGVLTTLDQKRDPVSEDDIAVQIRSEKEAKVAAKRVFNNVARSRSRHIYLEDLMRFLREDEASRIMLLFEGARDGKGISKHALKNWVVNVFRERRALALSLSDTKNAVHKLHYLVNVLVGFGVVIIWLLILGLSISHFFVLASSQVVVMAIMFGNTCKTTFEAIIFLFVMHPFDVGDRCEIEGVQMVVEEMNILTTVFLRFDNQKIIYPNSVLATKAISNYYRSPEMKDAVDFCVHISTPVEKLSLMKERITRYVENKKEHWHPDPKVVMRDVEDMNKIMFSIWLCHTINHQDMGERWMRRGLFIEDLVRVFRDLDIEYRMLPVDINVRNMPALVSDRFPSNWTR